MFGFFVRSNEILLQLCLILFVLVVLPWTPNAWNERGICLFFSLLHNLFFTTYLCSFVMHSLIRRYSCIDAVSLTLSRCTLVRWCFFEYRIKSQKKFRCNLSDIRSTVAATYSLGHQRIDCFISPWFSLIVVCHSANAFFFRGLFEKRIETCKTRALVVAMETPSNDRAHWSLPWKRTARSNARVLHFASRNSFMK